MENEKKLRAGLYETLDKDCFDPCGDSVFWLGEDYFFGIAPSEKEVSLISWTQDC